MKQAQRHLPQIHTNQPVCPQQPLILALLALIPLLERGFLPADCSH